jgi:hypothetical protein
MKLALGLLAAAVLGVRERTIHGTSQRWSGREYLP